MGFLWQTLKHFNLRGYLYIWANLAFVLVSLPVLTIPVAWAALVRLSHLAQTMPHADIHDFWQAFRENFWRGLALGLLSALILGINLINLYAYRTETGVFVYVMRAVWLGIVFFWFSLQIYVWPIFYEMETPNLLLALRNAALMFLLNPIFTLALWLVIGLVVFLSNLLPFAYLLLSISFCACLSASATLNRLQAAGYLEAKEV